MLRNGEFDIAEVSLSSYVLAKSRGLKFTAVPVFPRRLFSQTQMFVRADSPIESPKQLEGKRVALQSFQTTLAVLAKGDLAFAYGVPWRSVTWHARNEEALPLEGRMDAKLVQLPDKTDFASLLVDGEVDALFYSRFPRSPRVPPERIRRLFGNAEGEALRYYREVRLVSDHARACIEAGCRRRLSGLAGGPRHLVPGRPRCLPQGL